MKSTGKYVIFNEKKDEFLHAEAKGDDFNILGWSKTPINAIKYNSFAAAENIAQRIADHKNYCLLICEIHESDTKIGLANSKQILPKSTPSRN